MSSREPGETWRGEKSCRKALLLLRGISTGSLCPFPVLKTCCTALQNSWASSHFVVELNSIVRFILSPCISVWVVPQGLQLYTFKSLHGDTALMLFFQFLKEMFKSSVEIHLAIISLSLPFYGNTLHAGQIWLIYVTWAGEAYTENRA